MPRNSELEKHDFSFIRNILKENYSHIPQQEIQPVSEGLNSHSYIVGNDSQKYFLKLSIENPKKKAKSSPDTMLRFMKYAHDNGIETPEPIINDHGTILAKVPSPQATKPPYTLSMLNYIDGKSVDFFTSKETNFPQLSPKIAAEIAKLHSVQEQAPFTLADIPQSQQLQQTTQRILTSLGLPQDKSLEEILAELNQKGSPSNKAMDLLHSKIKAASDLQLKPENKASLTALSEAIANGLVSETLKHLINQQRRQSLREELPRGVCHGDCHPGNVLQKNGHVVALIDFDEIVYDTYANDVANLMMNCYEVPSPDSESMHFDSDIAVQTLAGYHAVRPLSTKELEAIPDIMAEFQLAHLSYNLETLSEKAGLMSGMHPQNAVESLPSPAQLLRPQKQLSDQAGINKTIHQFKQQHAMHNDTEKTAPVSQPWRSSHLLFAGAVALLATAAFVSSLAFPLILTAVVAAGTGALVYNQEKEAELSYQKSAKTQADSSNVKVDIKHELNTPEKGPSNQNNGINYRNNFVQQYMGENSKNIKANAR